MELSEELTAAEKSAIEKMNREAARLVKEHEIQQLMERQRLRREQQQRHRKQLEEEESAAMDSEMSHEQKSRPIPIPQKPSQQRTRLQQAALQREKSHEDVLQALQQGHRDNGKMLARNWDVLRQNYFQGPSKEGEAGEADGKSEA